MCVRCREGRLTERAPDRMYSAAQHRTNTSGYLVEHFSCLLDMARRNTERTHTSDCTCQQAVGCDAASHRTSTSDWAYHQAVEYARCNIEQKHQILTGQVSVSAVQQAVEYGTAYSYHRMNTPDSTRTHLTSRRGARIFPLPTDIPQSAMGMSTSVPQTADSSQLGHCTAVIVAHFIL